jgi:transposase-like protein
MTTLEILPAQEVFFNHLNENDGNLERTCAELGVSDNLLAEWRKSNDYCLLEKKYTRTRVTKAETAIMELVEQDDHPMVKLQAAKFFLESRDPNYAPKNPNQVNVNIQNNIVSLLKDLK